MYIGYEKRGMSNGESEKDALLPKQNNVNNMRQFGADLSTTKVSSMESPYQNHAATMPSENGTVSAPVQYTYEELSSGFTCPTCNGLGKIPREREGDLVALIPYNDSRLKPRRTYLYVILSVLACAILAGVLCAFLVPRQIEMKVMSVETQTVSINTTASKMKLILQTEFSVNNENFVTAYGQNATVTGYWSELMKGVNTTAMPVAIGGRMTKTIFANVTVEFTEGFLVTYCSSAAPTHIIYMQFIATLQFKLMSQNQQLTEVYYSAIKCQLDS